MEMNKQIAHTLFLLLSILNKEVNENEICVVANKDNEHGDFSTNACLRLSKKLNKKPIEIATYVAENFKLEGVKKAEIAGIGFVNFYLEIESLGSIINEIISKGDRYGESIVEEHNKVNLEYVSANPTGYLHLGHARGAALGDSLARIMTKAGYDVTREYYINDAGNQVNLLGQALMIRYQQICGMKVELPENSYHGEEVIIVAKSLYEKYGDKYSENNETNFKFFKENGISLMLDQIKKDLSVFRVSFNNFVSETWIRNSNRIEKCLEKLKPFTYVEDGATFLNTTKDGDDKDRVIIKKDGSYSYFCPDIAYHDYKYERGYDQIITVLGADHHGYIPRLKSAMKSLGHDETKIHVPLVQIVRLFKNGEEFRMSKRTGNAISMVELLDMVGIDATRYFFVSRSGTQHLDFDLDLAQKLGNTNPVYYAQYTHARLNAILEKAKLNGIDGISTESNLLITNEEKTLMKILYEFPKVITDAATSYEPYKVCNFIQQLSSAVNTFYVKNRVIDSENIALSKQRLGLCLATRITLKNALDLIGVSAPLQM